VSIPNRCFSAQPETLADAKHFSLLIFFSVACVGDAVVAVDCVGNLVTTVACVGDLVHDACEPPPRL